MSGIINKVKEALHHDKDDPTAGSTGHSTTHPTTTHGSTNAGPHDSNVANKANPRVDSDLDGSRNMGANQTTSAHGNTGLGSTTHGSTNAGPHSSNATNKADPRVDSDLDGSRNMGANQTTSGYGNTSTTGAGYGGSSTTGVGHGSADTRVGHGSSTTGAGHGTSANTGTTDAGPHKSHIANVLDPRVDSDLDGSRTVGGNKTHSTTHGNTAVGAGFGSSTTTGAGHSTTGAGHGPTTAGPYSSNLANKADPRVDSDLDGRGGYGSSTTTGAGYGSSTRAGHSTTGAGLGSTTGAGHSTTGTGYGSTTAGPHSSNLGNKADPRVDSDLDGRGGYGSSATTGAGHSTSTTGAGYGSSTIGAGYGSSTAGAGYGSSTTTAGSGPAPNTAGPHKSDMLNKMDPRVDSDNSKTSGANEPLDAAKHRPSVFQATQGDPSIEHDNPQHSLAGRHGSRRGSVNDYGSGVH